MKPHPLFEVWSPDEVAECLPNVGDEVYRELWKLVRHYDGKPRSEVNDDFQDRCLANWFNELSMDHRKTLNILANVFEEGLK